MHLSVVIALAIAVSYCHAYLQVISSRCKGVSSRFTSMQIQDGTDSTRNENENTNRHDILNSQVTTEKLDKCIKLITELEQPVTNLKGVGPSTAALFQKLGIYTVRSLLWHFPTQFIDRSKLWKDISSASDGTTITTILTIKSFDYSNPVLFWVQCYDPVGNFFNLVYFHGQNPTTTRKIRLATKSSFGKPGSQRVVSGKIRHKSNGQVSDWDIVQPDIVKPIKGIESVQRILVLSLL